MTYTKKQFIEDVKKEARKLKRKATSRERRKLGIRKFSPSKRANCIYGLMTGDCFSARAIDLITECTPIFIDNISASDNSKLVPTDAYESGNHWSPIEFYVTQEYAQNKNLIDYLKGNRNDLVL